MRLGVGLAACLVLGACAEGDDARQTTSPVLGGDDDDSDSTTGGQGMTSMGSNTWTPATEGDPGTGSGSDGRSVDPDSSSDGGDDGPVDPYAPCQGQQAPVDPVEHWTPGVVEGPSRSIVLIGPPSHQGGTLECDPFTQDCPDGEKCMPWADDGGSELERDALHSRSHPNPQQIGEDCTAEGSSVSGVDNCDIGA